MQCLQQHIATYAPLAADFLPLLQAVDIEVLSGDAREPAEQLLTILKAATTEYVTPKILMQILSMAVRYLIYEATA